MEAVSRVLLERATPERGLARMLTASLGAHAVLAALILLVPSARGARAPDLRDVMTISLGGAPGPSAGGMTMAGGPAARPVAPTEAPKRDAGRPAAKPPAMTLPSSARIARPAPKPAAAPASPAGTAAGTGEASLNPNRGLGFGGLSTGGGLGSGSYLDVKNFCCPDYLVTMLQLVQNNWNARQQVGGEALVVFRIQRDGRLTDIELERSSGFPALDLTAQRALFLTQRVPPLPSAFPDDHLTVHLRFEYRR
ncbi:MAG TPA: energy transducer TonB [Vicinamibacterales bacterium]|nr:energy transducer TonB [Vicinamibacterales bacterium]HPW21887.1 energy transducer TonB [Vicinamibacterales bacterium]